MGEVVKLRQSIWSGRGDYVDWVVDNCGCSICAGSTPDRKGERVMSGTIARPDESLAGLLIVCAAKARLPGMRPFLVASATVRHGSKNLAVRDDLSFDQIAFATRVAPHDVALRRYESVATDVFLPLVNFHGTHIPAYDLSLGSRRVAPAALREVAYHSALGHHGIATHCPRTGELLIDACPVCDTKLGWSGCAVERCQSCDADLRTVEGRRLPQELLDASELMIDLIHPHPARHLTTAERLPPGLRHLARGTAFELGWRLGCVAAGIENGERHRAKSLPVDDRLSILQAGSAILAGWPGSLAGMIAERLQEHDGTEAAATARRIRSIARAKHIWPEVRQTIEAALPELSISISRAVKTVLSGGADSREARNGIGVCQRTFMKIRAAGGLRPTLESGTRKKHQIFDGGQICSLRSKLEDRVTFGSLCQELGISRHGVEQLCCLGLLRSLDDEVVRTAFVQRYVDGSQARALMSTLAAPAARIEAETDTERLVSLRQATRSIGGRPKPWGPILSTLIDGTLTVHLNATEGLQYIDRVHVEPDDVSKITALGFEKADYPEFRFEHRMKGEDVEETLNLSARPLQEAITEENIEREEDGLFDCAIVIDLARRYISGGEILMRWCGGGRRKPSIFRGRQRLLRSSIIGWDRDEVERAMRHTPGYFDQR